MPLGNLMSLNISSTRSQYLSRKWCIDRTLRTSTAYAAAVSPSPNIQWFTAILCRMYKSMINAAANITRSCLVLVTSIPNASSLNSFFGDCMPECRATKSRKHSVTVSPPRPFGNWTGHTLTSSGITKSSSASWYAFSSSSYDDSSESSSSSPSASLFFFLLAVIFFALLTSRKANLTPSSSLLPSSSSSFLGEIGTAPFNKSSIFTPVSCSISRSRGRSVTAPPIRIQPWNGLILIAGSSYRSESSHLNCTATPMSMSSVGKSNMSRQGMEESFIASYNSR
mmetsp:Transcript_45549/g.120327  ORF Transcript_45549/g.120327 Transcript_45549/m.120327 type:complete len:282 (+) Transcript_45549:1131-1976(+)